MESSEIKKYAETVLNMTTDYLMGNYSEDMYKSILKIIANKINE